MTRTTCLVALIFGTLLAASHTAAAQVERPYDANGQLMPGHVIFEPLSSEKQALFMTSLTTGLKLETTPELEQIEGAESALAGWQGKQPLLNVSVTRVILRFRTNLPALDVIKGYGKHFDVTLDLLPGHTEVRNSASAQVIYQKGESIKVGAPLWSGFINGEGPTGVAVFVLESDTDGFAPRGAFVCPRRTYFANPTGQRQVTFLVDSGYKLGRGIFGVLGRLSGVLGADGSVDKLNLQFLTSPEINRSEEFDKALGVPGQGAELEYAPYAQELLSDTVPGPEIDAGIRGVVSASAKGELRRRSSIDAVVRIKEVKVERDKPFSVRLSGNEQGIVSPGPCYIVLREFKLAHYFSAAKAVASVAPAPTAKPAALPTIAKPEFK